MHCQAAQKSSGLVAVSRLILSYCHVAWYFTLRNNSAATVFVVSGCDKAQKGVLQLKTHAEKLKSEKDLPASCATGSGLDLLTTAMKLKAASGALLKHPLPPKPIPPANPPPPPPRLPNNSPIVEERRRLLLNELYAVQQDVERLASEEEWLNYQFSTETHP